MTTTYTAGTTTTHHPYRAELGDTGPSSTAALPWLLDDEEIQAVLDEVTGFSLRMARLCDMAANRMIRKAHDVSMPKTSRRHLTDMAAAFEKRAAFYRKQAKSSDGTGVPTVNIAAGGQSKAERDAMALEQDRLHAGVYVGQDEDPTLSQRSGVWSPDGFNFAVPRL